MTVSDPKRPWRTRCCSLLREPLVHFVFAAALLTAAYHFFGKPEVKISPQLLGGLRKEYEVSMGREATPEEVKRMVDHNLENEILYREALRAGLTQDPRIRNLLIQTMRASLRPIVPIPSDSELETLRAESPETYRFPARVSFEHVSYPDAASVPAGLLEKLRSGASREGLGDPKIKIANPLPPTFRPQVEYLFGATCAAEIFQGKVGDWNGPFTSQRGVHFIRVLSMEPTRDMPMSELRPTLQGKWMAQKEAEEITRKVEEMRKSYRVVMPAIPSTKP